MDAEALIAAFRRLQTGDSRRDFIDALLAELTPYEWRTTQRELNARTFRCDIIGRLPVELVAQVSRKWQHVLLSPDILRSGLLSWYGKAANLQRADHRIYLSKAKQAQAFRHGIPTQRLKINLQFSVRLVTLIDDTLIWAQASADKDARVLHLLKIKTWSLQSLNGDAREKIKRIFASDQLVGLVTVSTICYVWSRRNLEKRQFRLPGHSFSQSITCRGSTVACAGLLKEHTLVYIWDYETQSGRSFTINYDSSLFANPNPDCLHQYKYTIFLLLQPKPEYVTVFVEDHCLRNPGTCTKILRYAQFTYAGSCFAKSELNLQNIEPLAIQLPPGPLIPVDREGRYRMNFDRNGRVQFDERLFAFTERHPVGDENTSPEHNSLHWWKDVSFATCIYLGKESIPEYTMLAHLGTSDSRHTKDLDGPRYDAYGELLDFDEYREDEVIQLNDEFLVRARGRSFEILCFGEDPQLTEQNGSFFDIGFYKVAAGSAKKTQ